jgi:ATP-dependent Clp protease ATP-binding subunit ClpX
MAKKKEIETPLITAKEIYKGLNKYVVGQDNAKQALSVSVFLHLARTVCALSNHREPFKKSNLMLIGPTGVGKTYMMQTVKNIVDIPVFHINAKDLSSPGYVGTSLVNCFEMFIAEVGIDNICTAENSIIFVDEFDKLCIRDKEEVAGFARPIQYSLLKAIEGNDYPLTVEKKDVIFNTDNVLFVLGGSFQHMRDARKKKAKEKSSSSGIGFGGTAVESDIPAMDMHQELVDNGVIRELAGRISIVEELYDLTKAQLRQAFTRKEDSVFKQYQELLKFLGKDFTLSDYKINNIIDRCLKTGTGARGLQTALDLYMRNYMFNLKTDMTYEKALKDIPKEDEEDGPQRVESISYNHKDGVVRINMAEWEEVLGKFEDKNNNKDKPDE